MYFAGAMAIFEFKDHDWNILLYDEWPTKENLLFKMFVEGEHKHDGYEAYRIIKPTSRKFPLDGNCDTICLTQNTGIDSNERTIVPFSLRSSKKCLSC